MSPMSADGFSSRLELAYSYIESGRQTDSAFDACFEMYDSDAVAVALWAKLDDFDCSEAFAGNIWKYLSQESVLRAALCKPDSMSFEEWSSHLILEGMLNGPLAKPKVEVEVEVGPAVGDESWLDFCPEFSTPGREVA